MIIQKLCGEKLFDIYDNADKVLKDYQLIEVNESCRPGLDPMKDVIQ